MDKNNEPTYADWMQFLRQHISHSTARSSHLTWITCLLCLCISVILLSACNAPSQVGQRTQKSVAPTATSTPALLNQPITYVALGASDAVGVGSDKPGTQGYVPLISAHLAKGSHTLDLGISGIHLHEALNEELPRALSSSPQLITVWLVANDFVAGVPYTNYMDDLNTLLTRLRAQTHARIVMANLPDLTRLPAFHRESPEQKVRILQSIKTWNQGMARLATRQQVALVDLFQDSNDLTAHPDYISRDGFHPSTAGYIHLAQLFWQAIQKSS